MRWSSTRRSCSALAAASSPSCRSKKSVSREVSAATGAAPAREKPSMLRGASEPKLKASSSSTPSSSSPKSWLGPSPRGGMPRSDPTSSAGACVLLRLDVGAGHSQRPAWCRARMQPSVPQIVLFPLPGGCAGDHAEGCGGGCSRGCGEGCGVSCGGSFGGSCGGGCGEGAAGGTAGSTAGDATEGPAEAAASGGEGVGSGVEFGCADSCLGVTTFALPEEGGAEAPAPTLFPARIS